MCFRNIIEPIALEITDLCNRYNIYLESGITTNGYLINEEMIPFFCNTNMQSFLITLDSSKDMHNKVRFQRNASNSYQKIVDNIILLAEKLEPKDLNLRINFTKESFNSITNIINSFYPKIRKKIKVSLVQIIQDQRKNKIPIHEIETTRLEFEKAGFMSAREILKTKGYRCHADLYNQVIINYDGRVFKCPAQNFEKEKEDGILTKKGNIIWHENLLSRKMCRAGFDNDTCMNCKYLPVCFGLCSQKLSNVNVPEDINKYFSYCNDIENYVNMAMDEFKKTDLGLAHISKYK